MANQNTADAYFERARELEDHAQRVEQVPATNLASERGDATVLRREAAWWRAFAMALAEAA